jgi:putative ABC transport system permease protein
VKLLKRVSVPASESKSDGMKYFIKSVGIALQNIKANPLHTFLSTLGIIIGVASLVAILALGDGLEQTGREQLANTTSLNILNISSDSYKTVDEIRVPIQNRPKLTVAHARYLEEKYVNRATVEIIDRTTAEVSFGDSTTSTYLQGNLENGLEFINDTLAYGRFFTREDIERTQRVAVVTHALTSRWNINTDNLLGSTFKIFGEEFEVIGVFPEREGDVPRIAIPLSIYSELKEGYPTISLKVDKAEEIPVIEEEIRPWLDEEFETGADGFSLVSNKSRIEQFSRGILLFKLVMGAITGISVLVGGIGVMNVLLISVTERTKEIGIRKASGAKKKDIVMQFMSESVTISLVGCAFGWILGMIGLLIFVPLVNNLTNANFSAAVSIDTVLVVMLIALVIGVVFGTYPAWRASQLDPIDAIRHE